MFVFIFLSKYVIWMGKEIVKIVLLTNFTMCAMAHPDFGRSVDPISTRGDRLSPPYYYWHNRIFRPSDGPELWSSSEERFLRFLLPIKLHISTKKWKQTYNLILIGWKFVDFFSLFFVKACGKIIVYYFQTYRKMTNIDETMRESDFHKRSKGLNEMKVADRLQEFGPNFIKISVPPILYLVFHEVIYAPSTFNLQIYFQNEMTLVLEFQF